MAKSKLKKLKKSSKASSIITKLQKGDRSEFLEKIANDLQQNRSLANLALGALIIILVGVLVINYFRKQDANNLGPAQQTINQQSQTEDISKDNLPGKYTVKDGDTLFEIAQNYYGDGYKYPEIVTKNNLADENSISTGQVLVIPKLDLSGGTGGAENQTIWGERITGETYTVQSGDWLSKIAGRTYGDIYAFDKIAKANNISDPDKIEVGTNLKIPR